MELVPIISFIFMSVFIWGIIHEYKRKDDFGETEVIAFIAALGFWLILSRSLWLISDLLGSISWITGFIALVILYNYHRL